MRKTDMSKAKEIISLHRKSLSVREIGIACSVSKSTVADVLKRAREANISDADGISSKELMSILYPPRKREGGTAKAGGDGPGPDMKYVAAEMLKPHVTLMLLWEEYKHEHPGGIMYTQFCDRYRKHMAKTKVDMHKEHAAGMEAEVDWAGTTIKFTDLESGANADAYLFVIVLAASNYMFAHAYADMKQPSWIDGHVRAFEFFGGAPRFLVPDNCKTSVVAPEKYDPVLTKAYDEMARHYNAVVMPARSYSPKDKNMVENGVLIASRRIIAALRNERFFGIKDVNAGVAEKLAELNRRPLSRFGGSRESVFNEVERPLLQQLPAKGYEPAEWKETTVSPNYHVQFDGHYYSVKHTYARMACSVRATVFAIEVFIDGQRVASHRRSYDKRQRYVTKPEHMPIGHQYVSGWNNDMFLKRAGEIGPFTRALIAAVLGASEIPMQAYRGCQGILRLAKEADAEVAEAASRWAAENNCFTPKYYKMAIGMELEGARPARAAEKIISHGNMRGKAAFEGGERDAR